MSLESTIRGVLTEQVAPKQITEAKDPNEYDQEGDMMKSQLRQINSAIDKLMGMVKDDDNLPEWVQSKMTKATDYIRSVRDYLESEKMDDDEEEMDEAYSPMHVKQAIGIASDKRYKGGNMTGAVAAIEKLKKGLSNHPQVKAVLKRVNEEWVCGKCNCDPCTCEENLQEGINQKKFAAGAKAMKAYAMKHGGVDKADFMKVADSLAKISRINLLQAGQELSRLNRLVDNQDTDVRERIYVELKKVGLVESLEEKTLTPAELKKREEIAKAIERENPDMPMPQKMAIATAQAKKTAEAYDEPQGQAKSMMSPLHKARMDKEKADRDRDGKLKPGIIKVKKEETGIEEAKKVSSMQIHKVLAPTKNSREGIAALKKAFRVNDMEAKKMLNKVMNEATIPDGQTVMTTKPEIKKKDKDTISKIQDMMRREREKRMNKESLDEISRTMTPMRKKFGGTVDPKKFDMYKKHIKQHRVDEPTVRMVIDNPDDAESKRMMKNKHVAQAVSLRKAAMKESIEEAKKPDETINIRQSLKKAIDMRGQKQIVFKDGSKAKISVQDAEKAMKMLDNTRMAKAKQDLTIRMMKSHQEFKDTLAGKKPKVDPFALRVKTNEVTRSADKKPEKYIDQYGKTKIRMVPTDREVIKTESTFASKFKADLREKKRAMKETKGAPKGYHFTKDGKLKKGDAGQDGPGGKMLRSDPLDKQRSKIPPLPENDK